MVVNQEGIMPSVVTWDSKEYSLVEAKVLSSVNHDGQRVIIYEGTDPSTNLPYSGRLNLQLNEAVQTVEGQYENRDGKHFFRLTGKFTDESLTNFTGRWDEEGWTADFSF
jgi:hypothetical protein